MFKETRRGLEDRDEDVGGDIVHITILEYLEGFNPVGPSLDTFKLAMLNKKMMTIVKYIYGVSDFQEFAISHAKQRMIKTFQSEPNYQKYTQNGRALQRIKGAWNNKVFGGSVMNPVRAAITGLGGLRERRPDGKKIEKKNMLRKLIEEADVDTYHGGGFYNLKNVQTSSNTFLDIEIFITGGVGKKDQALLNKWQAISNRRSKVLPVPDLSERLVAPNSKPLLTDRFFSP